MRNTKVAHKDETGLRKDGNNGYVWGVFSPTNAAYHVSLSRGKKIAKKFCVKDPPDPKQYSQAQWTLQDITTILQTRKGGTRLATHIKNGGMEWLTALKHDHVPLTNNLAERLLRKVVVLRKMMGCYRNRKGQRFIENVLSTIQTWQLQNKNPYTQLTQHLT